MEGNATSVSSTPTTESLLYAEIGNTVVQILMIILYILRKKIVKSESTNKESQ